MAEHAEERSVSAAQAKYPKTMKRLGRLQKKTAGMEIKLKILISLFQMLAGIGKTAC